MEITMTPEIPANEIDLALMERNIDPKDEAYDDDDDEYDGSSAVTNPYENVSLINHTCATLADRTFRPALTPVPILMNTSPRSTVIVVTYGLTVV